MIELIHSSTHSPDAASRVQFILGILFPTHIAQTLSTHPMCPWLHLITFINYEMLSFQSIRMRHCFCKRNCCNAPAHSIRFHFILGRRSSSNRKTAECYYIQLKCLCHWIKGVGSVGLNCVQVPEIRAIANHQRSKYEFFVHCLLMPWVEYVLSTATITTTNRSTSHQHKKSNRISLSFLSFIQSYWLLWCDVWDIEKL